MMTFDWPYLFFLLPAPLIFYWLVPEKHRQQSPLYMPFIKQRHIEKVQLSVNQRSLLTSILMSLIWLCLIMAAAKPIKIGEAIELPATGRDLLLAVDISGSMEIEDMELNGKQVNRLSAVKKVVNDFIQTRQGDRLGLILFGSAAYIQSPLTFDLPTVSTLLEEAEIGFAGQETAIGDAIGLAIKRLTNNPNENRILILLTDGKNTAGSVDPIKASQLAKEQGVTIYTIGMGSDKRLRRSIFGLRSSNPSRDLDEAMLKNIAQLTNGQYFRARDPKELNDIYASIDKIEAIEQDAEIFRPQQQMFFWPLGGAMLLSGLLIILKSRTGGRTAKND